MKDVGMGVAVIFSDIDLSLFFPLSSFSLQEGGRDCAVIIFYFGEAAL